jgi:hypothetical protein
MKILEKEITNMPTLRQLRKHPEEYPDWKLCPKCRGDRGQINQSFDAETGQPIVTMSECTLCLGVRMIAVE